MRIASMCGSLGVGSTNRAALRVAVEHLQSTGRTSNVTDIALTEVPMFDPARVEDPPPEVAERRSVLEHADGLLLAAPEYAGGLAGGMKNALDWLVGSGSIYHRPVAVLSAGTTGGGFALEQLVRTLSWQGALVIDSLGISAPNTKSGPAGFKDAETITTIQRWAERLVDAVSMTPLQLLKRVTDVVTPFGIDPSRFGDLR
jgi:chromate reductase, NAD(P)H dehydrogenase (quinone)